MLLLEGEARVTEWRGDETSAKAAHCLELVRQIKSAPQRQASTSEYLQEVRTKPLAHFKLAVLD